MSRDSVLCVMMSRDPVLSCGVCPSDEEIRDCVLTSLDERFDAHLAQADNLTTLFVAMHDGVSTHTTHVHTCTHTCTHMYTHT